MDVVGIPYLLCTYYGTGWDGMGWDEMGWDGGGGLEFVMDSPSPKRLADQR